MCPLFRHRMIWLENLLGTNYAINLLWFNFMVLSKTNCVLIVAVFFPDSMFHSGWNRKQGAPCYPDKSFPPNSLYSHLRSSITISAPLKGRPRCLCRTSKSDVAYAQLIHVLPVRLGLAASGVYHTLCMRCEYLHSKSQADVVDWQTSKILVVRARIYL